MIENWKISLNDGFYMTKIACDRIIFKEAGQFTNLNV